MKKGHLLAPLFMSLCFSVQAWAQPAASKEECVIKCHEAAALINVNTPATSSGAVVTITGAHQLVARVGGVGSIIRETKRQKRSFQITFWCPNPALRDAIVPPVDQALADLEFLSLPDGSGGRLLYERSTVSDRVEREGLYRRDLIYSVEYPTTETQSAAQIVAEIFNIDGGLDPSAPPVTSFTI